LKIKEINQENPENHLNLDIQIPTTFPLFLINLPLNFDWFIL
jgi:hypothetical protein